MAVQQGDYAAVSLLLAKGADPDVADPFRNSTPLHTAARMGDHTLLRQLLSHGANPDVADRDGRTPLHLQAERIGSGEALGWLIDAGARPDAKDKDGISPLMFAAGVDARDCVQRLLDRGATINLTDANGRCALSRALDGSNVPVAFGNTSYRSGLAVLLLEKGARLDGNAMSAAFLRAAARGDRKLLVALLDGHPACLNACDNMGKTALHHAALQDNEPVVDFLLQRGAQTDRKDQRGFTPADYVSENSITAHTFARYAGTQQGSSRTNEPPPRADQNRRGQKSERASATEAPGFGEASDWQLLGLQAPPAQRRRGEKSLQDCHIARAPGQKPGTGYGHDYRALAANQRREG